jgi:hypothetical protein
MLRRASGSLITDNRYRPTTSNRSNRGDQPRQLAGRCSAVLLPYNQRRCALVAGSSAVHYGGRVPFVPSSPSREFVADGD